MGKYCEYVNVKAAFVAFVAILVSVPPRRR